MRGGRLDRPSRTLAHRRELTHGRPEELEVAKLSEDTLLQVCPLSPHTIATPSRLAQFKILFGAAGEGGCSAGLHGVVPSSNVGVDHGHRRY